MPKYKNKFAAQMKQHQVDTLTTQYAAFLDDMDRMHEERIQQMRDEHKDHKARLIKDHEKQKQDLLAEATVNVKQNKSQQPMQLDGGVIVLPGDYYVDEDVHTPFGISAADLEVSYEKA